MKKIVFLLIIFLTVLIILRNQKTAQNEPSQPFHESRLEVQEEELISQETKVKKEATPNTRKTIAPKPQPQERDPNHLMMDQDNELQVSSFMVVDDNAISFGDILVAPVEEILELERTNQQPTIPKPRIWPEGIVPFVIDPEVEQEYLIQNVMRFFHQHTPIRFIERTDEEDYVTFLRGSEHCYAHLGRIGGRQKVVLAENCGEAEIAHELMHTLGFIHEQNREDRDQFLQIFWNNIDENFHEQFKIIPSQFHLSQNHPLMEFSFETIMIYHPFAFSLEPERPAMLKTDGNQWPAIGALLGPRDIERLKLTYGRR
jgi:hypothetical protein